MAHLSIPKTYKLFSGGAFPRSESGRTYPVTDAKGEFMANAAQGSRKDLRDAVVAARKGHQAWAKATPYNRGQVVYRMAEMLDGRAPEFVDLLRRSRGMTAAEARSEVQAAVDRLVHFAGWTDKISAVFGGANPVSGPYFSYSACEPTGVVGVVAPTDAPLLGLVSVVAPIVAGGNSVVVLAAQDDPCVAITFGEVLATSDTPAGAINLLTGDPAEMGPHLAAHQDVNGLDLTGADDELRLAMEQAASQTLKRIHVGTDDFTAAPGTARLRAFLEVKSVWHPVGAVSLAGGSAY